LAERTIMSEDREQLEQFAAPTGDGAESNGLAESNGGLSFGSTDGGGGAGEYFGEEESKPKVSRTTLAMVGVLALGAAGVWFMYQRAGGPGRANAAVVKETKDAQKTIQNFLGNNGESIKSMESMLKNTEKVVQTFLNYPSMTQVPLSDLRTNPFRQKNVKAPTGAPDDAADRRRREEERLAMLKAVQGLQLQSVMCSDTRRACMINNALYMETQQVDGFTIEKITAASVVVKNGVYRFELKMER
jgi:hypothetical protein